MAADDGGAGRARGDASWRPPVNLKALARHLKLSSTTVSLVVNDSPAARSIPQRTKDRILAAARELNYRPSYLARSLRSRRSLTIGVLIPEVSEGYAAGILAGIDSLLMQEGYFYQVASHHDEPGLLEEHVKLFQDRSSKATSWSTPPSPGRCPSPQWSSRDGAGSRGSPTLLSTTTGASPSPSRT